MGKIIYGNIYFMNRQIGKKINILIFGVILLIFIIFRRYNNKIKAFESSKNYTNITKQFDFSKNYISKIKTFEFLIENQLKIQINNQINLYFLS